MFYQIIVTFKNNRKKVYCSTWNSNVAMASFAMAKHRFPDFKEIAIRCYPEEAAKRLGYTRTEMPPIIFGKKW